MARRFLGRWGRNRRKPELAGERRAGGGGKAQRCLKKDRKEAPPKLQVKENEVCVIQAVGRCGGDPAGFLLGNIPFIKGRRHHELGLGKIMARTVGDRLSNAGDP